MPAQNGLIYKGLMLITICNQNFISISNIFRRLKAKRALFKGRSLSLASFTLPVRKVPKLLPLVRPKSSNSTGKIKYRKNTQSDENYLQENKVQGELEILDLESLIDVSDVKKDDNKMAWMLSKIIYLLAEYAFCLNLK